MTIAKGCISISLGEGCGVNLISTSSLNPGADPPTAMLTVYSGGLKSRAKFGPGVARKLAEKLLEFAAGGGSPPGAQPEVVGMPPDLPPGGVPEGH